MVRSVDYHGYFPNIVSCKYLYMSEKVYMVLKFSI